MVAYYQSDTWSVRYRPKHIDEMILPVGIKTLFQRYLDGVGRQPLVLFGKPGTGKTLMGTILNTGDLIRIDCGKDDDLVRIRRMLSSATSIPMMSDRRTILIDDCENLSGASRHALREIERLTSVNDFIFTTNRIDLIDDALRSRLTEITFDFCLTQELKNQIRDKLRLICHKEAIEPPNEASLNYLATKHYPDMRKIIGELQRMIAQRQDAS